MSGEDSQLEGMPLLQPVLQTVSTEDADQTPDTKPDTHTSPDTHLPQPLRSSEVTDGAAYVSPEDNDYELISFTRVLTVEEVDDEEEEEEEGLELDITAERDGDQESSDKDSEEREGNSGFLPSDAGMEKSVVKEESNGSPAVFPRWERKPMSLPPPVLGTRRLPPPLPPRQRTKPLALPRRQSAPLWGRVGGESPGLEQGPTGLGRGPGGQEEEASFGVRPSVYSAVVPKSEQRFSQPPLDFISLGGEGVHQKVTGSNAVELPKTSELVGIGEGGAPIPKPRRWSRPVHGSASSGAHVGDTKAPQLVPPGTERVRQTSQPNKHNTDGKENSRTPADAMLLESVSPNVPARTSTSQDENSGTQNGCLEEEEQRRLNVNRGGTFVRGRDFEGAQEVPVQDISLGVGVLELGGCEAPPLKPQSLKKTTGVNMKKLAKKMMGRLKENGDERRGGQEESHRERPDREGESSIALAHLHLDRPSIRLETQMSVREEEEREGKVEEEEERSDEAVEHSPMSEPSKEMGGNFQSSFSSFKFNFIPNLVDEILSGEEWSRFLSVDDSPTPTEYVDQSEAESLQRLDQNDQSVTGSEACLPQGVEQHKADIDQIKNEGFSQSEPDMIVDSQLDGTQQEVNNNNGGVAIPLSPRILLDNSVVKGNKLYHFRPKSIEFYDSELYKIPKKNQSEDPPPDFSCVKSLGVLDSSAQKHRIGLNKKRKCRPPGQSAKEVFKIPRTGFPKSSHPVLSPNFTSSSSSLSSHHSFLSSSVFYTALPSTEQQDSVTSQETLSLKTAEGSSKPGGPQPPLSKWMSALRDKAKRKPKQ